MTAPSAKSPADIRREGNRLKHENSLYLRQHAHNPIDWYPWGEEALRRARAEDKPLFISIGYSSCHWCHVMEREVFEKDDVADFMNANFVCVKIDREERPDIDKIYMDATQMVTGSGGWPLSVFTTPDLKPFAVGTYIPYPQFLGAAKRLSERFKNERAEVDTQAGELAAAVAEQSFLVTEQAVFDSAWFTALVKSTEEHFDKQYGGVGQMKFPTPLRWRFLLHWHRKTGDFRSGTMVRLTLDKMGDGGIQDHLAGGFHRYTVEPTWVVPHFEKMLYDNAQLAALYTEAASVLKTPRYGEIARDTLEFLLRDMRGPERAFYSSYDADSDGHEGSFYLWTRSEFINLVGDTDGPALARLLGVTQEGNFERAMPTNMRETHLKLETPNVGRTEGTVILTRRIHVADVARETNRPVEEIAALFDKYRAMLREARAKRTWPGLDKKILTAWNGLTISALAQAALVFNEPRYAAAAADAVEFLWRVHRRPDGRFWRSSTNGVATNEGLLDDYAYLSAALLDLYQATGETTHLARGLELLATAQRLFANDKRAGFFLTPSDHPAPLGRQMDIFDTVTPSGSSTLLHAMLTASALTGDENLRRLVTENLAAFAGLMRKAELEMGQWFDVALRLEGPLHEVVICGDPSDPNTEALLAVVRDLAPSFAVLIRLPATGADAATRQLLPATAGKHAQNGQATAFVCRHGACNAPTTDPAELRAQLLAGWKK